MRYRGQGFELNVRLEQAPGRIAAAALVQRFEAEHRRRYGYAHSGREVEIVTLRLRARLRSRPLPATLTQEVRSRGPSPGPARTKAIMPGSLRPVETSILDRSQLIVRQVYRGPAIVTEYSATTVVPSEIGRASCRERV